MLPPLTSRIQKLISLLLCAVALGAPSAWAQTTLYEAESAVLSGPLVFNGRGSSGDAYVDYQNPAGDFVEWTVDATGDHPFELIFSYALDGSASRPLALSINGVDQGVIDFVSIGTWFSFSPLSIETTLMAGPNTVRLTAIGSSGPNIDFLSATEFQSAGSRIRLNFSDVSTPAPAGWLRDTGEAFGARGDGLLYGWLDAQTLLPTDLGAAARNRAPTPDHEVFRETLVHLQRAGLPEGVWEIELANGPYEVLVQVGDPDAEGTNPTNHVVRAEGVVIASFDTPIGGRGLRTGVATVDVQDGRLTVDAVGGANSKMHMISISPTGPTPATPAVLTSTPADGATDVDPATLIAANFFYFPNLSSSGATSLDNSSLDATTVTLDRMDTGAAVAGTINGTGGGDAIVFTPDAPLAENTPYRFTIDGARDLSGETLLPHVAEFVTGMTGGGGPGSALDSVAFEPAVQVATGDFTTLTIGPDGKLYGLAFGGDLLRWDLAADGTLENPETLTGLSSAQGNRLAIGLAFAPEATAQNLVAYVSHSDFTFSGGAAFDGRISRLSGPNLENEELIVTNLPRSIRDHLTNGIAFRPGEPNALYFLQGSNTAGGAPDGAWGFRPERLLSAALLRLDLDALPTTLPLDAQTTNVQSVINAAPIDSLTMADGTYNPYASTSPLVLYATGIRNAYDLVWHSNGNAYVPTNGTGGGSQSPASVTGTRRPDGTPYAGPAIPAIGPNETQRDFLFRISPAEPAGYFGHPNPLRGEFVLNRGPVDAADYPAGIVPDANYRGFAFDFGFNVSPNGVIEYKSYAHEGNLVGALLVVRYSGGSDVIALVPNDTNGDIEASSTTIPGLDGFADPLDLVEDIQTGNVYVSDLQRSEIVLLRPTLPAPESGFAISLTIGISGLAALRRRSMRTRSQAAGDREAGA